MGFRNDGPDGVEGAEGMLQSKAAIEFMFIRSMLRRINKSSGRRIRASSVTAFDPITILPSSMPVPTFGFSNRIESSWHVV